MSEEVGGAGELHANAEEEIERTGLVARAYVA
jgi:hypothetical protein